jgi:hypothetical protein
LGKFLNYWRMIAETLLFYKCDIKNKPISKNKLHVASALVL